MEQYACVGSSRVNRKTLTSYVPIPRTNHWYFIVKH